MSSDKMRLRLRLKRLNEIYSQLGRDPNADEYQLKTLVQEFDSLARKQITRLKVGKKEKLHSREVILIKYTYKSKER